METDPDFPITRRERLALGVVLAALALAAVACTCCARSYPLAPATRAPRQQWRAMVMIREFCGEPDATYGLSGAREFRGSGTMVSGDRLLTAAHVVACGDYPLSWPPLKVEVDYGDGWVGAKVAAYDGENDLAVLESGWTGPWFEPVDVGREPDMGDQVCAVTAFPVEAIRCGVVQPWPDRDSFLFMAPVEPGNSGSAVYDRAGMLVGVVSEMRLCSNRQFCYGLARLITPEIRAAFSGR